MKHVLYYPLTTRQIIPLFMLYENNYFKQTIVLPESVAHYSHKLKINDVVIIKDDEIYSTIASINPDIIVQSNVSTKRRGAMGKRLFYAHGFNISQIIINDTTIKKYFDCFFVGVESLADKKFIENTTMQVDYLYYNVPIKNNSKIKNILYVGPPIADKGGMKVLTYYKTLIKLFFWAKEHSEYNVFIKPKTDDIKLFSKYYNILHEFESILKEIWKNPKPLQFIKYDENIFDHLSYIDLVIIDDDYKSTILSECACVGLPVSLHNKNNDINISVMHRFIPEIPKRLLFDGMHHERFMEFMINYVRK